MELNVKHRDVSLDHLRGFAMIWVIFIHVLFWGKFFPDGSAYIFKSFLLFEMPLFFFITGASNSMGKHYPYFKFVEKRFERCLIPYWIYALICVTLSVTKNALKKQIGLFSALKIFASWVLPVNCQISSVPRSTWALWFIPVYLCIVLMIPLFIKLKKTKYSLLFLLALGFVFLGTAILNTGWIQNVLFYSIWTYIGLFYNDIKSYRKKNQIKAIIFTIIIAGVSIISLYALYKLGYSMDMQSNKFPPNIVFFFFSFATMPFLYLIHPLLELILKKIDGLKYTGKIFNTYCSKSMTVFLYQTIAFDISLYILNYINIGDSVLSTICKIVLCFLITVLLCGIFGITFGKIESWSIISYLNRDEKKRNLLHK